MRPRDNLSIIPFQRCCSVTRVAAGRAVLSITPETATHGNMHSRKEPKTLKDAKMCALSLQSTFHLAGSEGEN